MKDNGFSEEQIIQTLKELGRARCIAEVCRRRGIEENTFYKWKAK